MIATIILLLGIIAITNANGNNTVITNANGNNTATNNTAHGSNWILETLNGPFEIDGRKLNESNLQNGKFWLEMRRVSKLNAPFVCCGDFDSEGLPNTFCDYIGTDPHIKASLEKSEYVACWTLLAFLACILNSSHHLYEFHKKDDSTYNVKETIETKITREIIDSATGKTVTTITTTTTTDKYEDNGKGYIYDINGMLCLIDRDEWSEGQKNTPEYWIATDKDGNPIKRWRFEDSEYGGVYEGEKYIGCNKILKPNEMSWGTILVILMFAGLGGYILYG
jgi:hypothetical protein